MDRDRSSKKAVEVEVKFYDPDAPPPKLRWLIEPLVPEGAGIFWLGQEGSSKTLVARDLALNLALRGERVVYFSEDMPLERDAYFNNRLLMGYGAKFPRDTLYWAGRQSLNLYEDEAKAGIYRAINGVKPSLVVFDTYNKLWGAQTAAADYENWNAASIYASVVGEILSSFGCSVLTICHPPDSKPDRLPAGSALNGVADVRVLFTGTYVEGSDTSQFVMENTKSTRYDYFKYKGLVEGAHGAEDAPLRITYTPIGKTKEMPWNSTLSTESPGTVVVPDPPLVGRP